MDVRTLQASPVLRGLGLFLFTGLLTWLSVAAKTGDMVPLYPVAAGIFGIFVRLPALAKIQYWLVVYSAMLLSYVALGTPLEHAAWLSACLLVQVLTACGLMALRPMPGMYEPKNVLHFFLLTLLSVGLSATLAIPLNLNAGFTSAFAAWLNWFSEQLAAMMLIAPLFICWPKKLGGYRFEWPDVLPILSVFLMTGLARLVEGPGAIAFVLPALLWCAMRYRIHIVNFIVLAVGTFEIINISQGFVLSGSLNLNDPLCSTRLGVAMMALSPLLVATATYAHKQLLAQTQHRANHDFLTGALTRRAFTHKAHRLMRSRYDLRESFALLVMDLDYFKTINDSYGHAAGDQVLRDVAQLINKQLREMDIFGRLGGEEFILLLPAISLAQAQAVAERLRETVKNHEFRLKGGVKINVQVSIGLSWLAAERISTPLSLLIEQADEALYQAKAQGRDQVCTYMAQELPLEKLKLSIY